MPPGNIRETERQRETETETESLFAGTCPIFGFVCFLFFSEDTKENWLSLDFRRGIWVSGRKLSLFHYSFYNFWIIYAVCVLLVVF